MGVKNVNIKKGDSVYIISGEDKGKKGKVLMADPSENKILVEGINVRTKHTKPKKAGEQGGIVKQSIAVDASKAMVLCKKCNKPTRVANTILADGTKVRSCKKCNESLDAK
jgi:large subunit ribosomal protein L24